MDRKKLMEAAEAATPGPWRYESDWTHELYGADGTLIAKFSRASGERGREADASFLAAANPAVVLELLDRIAALEALLREARRYVETAVGEEAYQCAAFSSFNENRPLAGLLTRIDAALSSPEVSNG